MLPPGALLLIGLGAAPVPPGMPVAGPSWLEHLDVELEQTHMGQMGGEGPPPPSSRKEPVSGETFEVEGADLYRLECRSCHGPDGNGAIPEILPLIASVRATSLVLTERAAKNSGQTLAPGMARSLVADAEKELRDRLQHGGQRMPAFDYLSPPEVETLLGYLRILANAPEAGRPKKLEEPVTRVGELLARGTCHICHPATGPGVNPMMEHMRGVIPSLAAMPEQLPPERVILKVRQGGWGMMARMSRMPIYDYLTDAEVSATYLYLARYPPEP